MFRKTLAAALVAAVALGAALIGKSRLAAGEVVRVGAILSEPPSSFGETSTAVRQGLELAKKDLDREWAGAASVELVLLDCGGSASGAKEKLEELHGRRVDLVADLVVKPLSACAKPIADHRMIVLSASSSEPDPGTGANLFRVMPPAAPEARELGRWLHEAQLQRPVVVFTDDAAGRDAKASFVHGWGGLADALTTPVLEDQPLAADALERLAALKPDAVVLLTSAKTAAAVVGAACSREMKVRFFGTSALASPEFAKAAGADALRRCFFASAEKASAVTPRRASVEAAWRTAYGGTGAPREELFYAYDALQVLARAARGTGGDGDKVAMRLRAYDYDGTTGTVVFDSDAERRGPNVSHRAFDQAGKPIPFSHDLLGRGDRP